jgi:hypothetical protein
LLKPQARCATGGLGRAIIWDVPERGRRVLTEAASGPLSGQAAGRDLGLTYQVAI